MKELSTTQQGASPPFILLCRGRRYTYVVAVIFLLAVLIALRSSAFQQLSSHVLGGAERDAALYLWLTELLFHKLTSTSLDPLSMASISWWFNAPAFFPYTLGIAWSDNFFLPSLFTSGLRFTGLSNIEAYNLTLLTAIFLNGFCTFLFCFRLCGNLPASLLSGASFMGGSFFSAHLGHPQLLFAFWFPVGCLSLFRLIVAPSFTRGFVTSLCIVGAFLTTVYYALFLALLLLILVALLFLLRPHRLVALFSLRAFVGLLLPLTLLVPVALAYLSVQEVFGSRFLHEPFYFAASILSYFSASEFNLVYGNTARLSHSEGHLLLGLALLAPIAYVLAKLFSTRQLLGPSVACLSFLVLTAATSVPEVAPGWGVVVRLVCALGTWASFVSILWFLKRLGHLESLLAVSYLSNRALFGLITSTALICFLISLGPLGYADQSYTDGGLALGLYRAVYELFPGFSAARAIGRLGVVVFFLTCVAAGLSLSHIARHAKASRLRSVAIVAPFVLVALFEHFHTAYPLEAVPEQPKIFEQLAAQRIRGESAIVLPFSGTLDSLQQVYSWGEFAKLHVNAMRFSLESNTPIVNGYSGQRSRIIRTWPALLAEFPNADSLRTLSEIVGLRWIVFLGDANAGKTLTENIAQAGRNARVAASDAQGNLLIELLGSRVLDTDGAQFLVPSYPHGLMSLEMSLLPIQGHESVKVSVTDRDSKESIAELVLPADGSWQTYSFRVGSNRPRVNPLRIELRPSLTDGSQRVLFSRRSFYESLVPHS